MAGSFLLQPAKHKKVYFRNRGLLFFPHASKQLLLGGTKKENLKTSFAKTLKTSFWPEVEIAEGKFAIL